MPRNKGTFKFAASYEVREAYPLDPRMLVETKQELITQDTWPTKDTTIYVYNGLLVSVQQEKAVYMLVDKTKILNEDYSGWKRIDGSSSGEVSYEDIYIIEDITAQVIEGYVGGQLRIDGRGLSEAINSNKRVYIKYSNNAGEAGIIPCSAYREDVYYVSFRLNSSLYGFDFGADSQYIDETSMFYIDIQEKLESGKNIKTINGQSILGGGNLKIEGLSSAIPDWNENNPSAASYIKNRTHYVKEHTLETDLYLLLEFHDVSYYNEDTDGYYTKTDVKVKYDEDDSEYTIVIPKDTLIGYGDESKHVTIVVDASGEEFEFESYSDQGGIYLKVSNPNYGTNFRLLEYVTLDEAYIPDTIARKSDLENIGGGGSVDSETIKEIKTTLESHEELIGDLQNMKIDKENDDYYPQMSVGTADNLAGQGEATPSEFTTRQSGGGAILEGTARIEAIKGNSIVLKQLARSQGVTGSKDNSAGTDIAYVSTDLYVNYTNKINGHKVFVKVTDAYSDVSYYCFSDNVQINLLGETIFTANTTITDISRLIVRVPPGVNANWNINCLFIDLTQMFGAGNEPTTVEEFGKRIPIGINHALYNTGQMINLNPSGIKSYSADEKPIERFQDLSLIGKLFPDGMKSAGEFHDEIRYNKDTQKWEKITRIGELDLDDERLSWSRTGEPSQYFYGNSQDFLYKDHEVISLNSPNFTSLTWSRGEHAFTKNYSGNRVDAIALWKTDNGNCRLNICCDACQDVAVFKEYLKGKKIYYALNKPIVEELDEDFALNTGLNVDFNLDYQVWNGGIEELVADNPSSALKADIVYGFNAYGKIQENSNKIEELEKNKIVVDNNINADSDNPISNKLFAQSFNILSAGIKEVSDNIVEMDSILSNKEDKPIEIVLSDPADLIPADTGVTYYLNKTNIGLSEEDSYEDYYQKVLDGNVVLVTGSDYRSSVNKHVYEDCVTFNIATQFAEGSIMNGSITIHNSQQTSPNGAEYYVEVRIQITANNGGGESGGGSNIEVDAELSDTSENPVQNKVITEELNKKANTNAIPTKVSQLNNDSGFITASTVQENYQPKGNYLTEIPSEYITEKEVDNELSDTSENPVQNKVINTELKKKIEGEIEYVLPVSGMGVVPKDLVLSTPSGDPMHYMFIAAGAEYNDTESDIKKIGEYKDTIFHKKGCWYLNEVGDLTNEEMRLIYEDGFHTRKPNGGYPMFFQDLEYRTFLNRTDFQDPVRTTYSFSKCNKAVVIRTGKNTTTITQPTGMFESCERVIKILGVMVCASQITDREIGGMFNRCYALQEVKLKNLHRSISLEYSSNISKNSILYMINNAVKSENRITITLHEDAYNRLIDDEEISNAITTHGNIELSKPESN